ncbi:hypothetical protein BGX38DRAFT_1280781 [Terfezia claveryi]|nr:hypothetical protein BGX38DRAFT_1280781 [Terfezia claveryi]
MKQIKGLAEELLEKENLARKPQRLLPPVLNAMVDERNVYWILEERYGLFKVARFSKQPIFDEEVGDEWEAYLSYSLQILEYRSQMKDYQASEEAFDYRLRLWKEDYTAIRTTRIQEEAEILYRQKYESQYQDDYDYEAGDNSTTGPKHRPSLGKSNYPEPDILSEVLAWRVQGILPELGRLIVSDESTLLHAATRLGILRANGGQKLLLRVNGILTIANSLKAEDTLLELAFQVQERIPKAPIETTPTPVSKSIRMSNVEEVEGDEFEIKSKEIVETFVQGIRGLCAEQGKDFRYTMNDIVKGLPTIAMRTRTYKPNAWNMSLRVAAKEMPAELKKGGKELRGQLARYAKEHVYTAERKRNSMTWLKRRSKILFMGLKLSQTSSEGTEKGLEALSNSCNYAQELGIHIILMAASSEDKLHIATEGLAEKFAVLQDVKKVGIPQFELLIRGGMIEEEAREAVAQKAVKSRDQARKECTNALLKAINEQIKRSNKPMKSVPRQSGMFLKSLKNAGLRVSWLKEWGDQQQMEKVVQSQDAGNIRAILKALAEKQLQFSEGESDDVNMEEQDVDSWDMEGQEGEE